MNRLLEPPGEKAFNAPARWQTNPSNCILLVHDDVCIRRFSAQMLLRSGYQVATAGDAQAGWEALHSNSYDLLITGDNRPRFSGLELVKMLRSAQMELPVVLASGTLDKEELNRNRWLHIAATLPKLFTTDQLLATVKQVLRAVGSPRDRTRICFSTLAEGLSRIEPTSHWGINE